MKLTIQGQAVRLRRPAWLAARLGNLDSNCRTTHPWRPTPDLGTPSRAVHPTLFLRVELGCVFRQPVEANIFRDLEIFRSVGTGPVYDHQDKILRMGFANLGEELVHPLSVHFWAHISVQFPLQWADGAVDIYKLTFIAVRDSGCCLCLPGTPPSASVVRNTVDQLTDCQQPAAREVAGLYGDMAFGRTPDDTETTQR